MILKKNIQCYIIGLLILSGLFVFMDFSSCYALSYEDIKEYVNYTADYYTGNSVYQQIKAATNSNTMEFNIPSFISDYDNIYIYVGSGYVWYNCYNATSWNITVTSVRVNGSYKRFGYYLANPQISQISTTEQSYSNSPLTQCFSSTANNYNNLNGMNYTSEDLTLNYSLPPTYVGNQAVPQWNFLVYDNSINNSTYNGNLYTYYYIGPMYQLSRMKLGHITPYDSYYYEIYLRDVNTGIIKGECFVSENPYNPFSSDALYIDDHHDVYVNTIYLDYGGQYRLDVDSYYGTGGTDMSYDFDYYLFLPENAIVSGDYILGFGSGDFTSRDSSMQTVGALEEQTETVLGTLTNYTPLNSGDILNNVDILPMYTYSSGDSISNFFVDVLRNISEVFLLDDEVNLHLVLPIFSKEINIRSDFWITSDYLPQLADFIGAAWWFIICLGMLYKIDVLVELYNFGDFINASYHIYQTRRLL